MIYTTCGSCGITVPWRSRHKCCTNAGPLSIPGPGFNVRPVYSEIDMVTREEAVELSRRMEPVAKQARGIVKWDRRNDKIKRQREWREGR